MSGVRATPAIASVVHFYETHPINEGQILTRLRAAGIDLDVLTEGVLKDYDQDHFGGLDRVDRLAAAAGIDGTVQVLDVCSGVGGPARYLAHRFGCRVTGLDITASRHDAAIRFTAMVGLGHLVEFRLGNALEMPFDERSFDVVIAEEAFCHVPDKPRLIAECARVARPGGRIAFTDILRRDALDNPAERRLQDEMTFQELESATGYRRLLEENGCEVVVQDDLGPLWTRILVDRLAMYRSLEDTTVTAYGRAHFERWDRAYTFFVGLFGGGKLTGGRFVAIRRGR